MKHTLTKDEHAALADNLKEEYKAEGDNFILKIEGSKGESLDPLAALRARDHEKEARLAAEKKAKEAEGSKGKLEAEKLEAEKKAELAVAKTKEDRAAIEASYKTKLETKEAELKQQQEAFETERKTAAVNKAASEMAASISTVPKLLTPEVAKRLVAEKTESGDYVVRVLDKDGKPCADKLEDLQKEVVDNPEFKGIIKASSASGGVSDPGSPGSGSALPDVKTLDIANGDPKAVAEHMKQRRLAKESQV